MRKLILTFTGMSMPLLNCFAENQQTGLDTGDTAWMLMASALVMMMTPAGLALFYGGLTQNKSVLNTIGMSYVAYCTGIIAWIALGYSFAFSEGNVFIGGFDLMFLNGIRPDDLYGTIPTLLDVAFQGTFAAIAVAIVSGSVIERVRFSIWTLFSIFWVILVYAPICHWVWGTESGLLNNDLDFAGGTVIHVNAGVSGLVLSLLIGRRLKMEENRKPSSVKLMILGSALLWFGWHGFNGGSAYAADGAAASAILITNVAACIGGLTWLFIEWFIDKRPTLIGIASGAVSALVGITPAAGYVDVMGALAIGSLSSITGYLGIVRLKQWLGHDDTLDAFGMHGLVGIAGAILTGVFAREAVGGEAGLIDGNAMQVVHQLKAIAYTIVYSAIATFIIYKVITLIFGPGRIHRKIELEGMDIGYHGEHQIAIEKHNVIE